MIGKRVANRLSRPVPCHSVVPLFPKALRLYENTGRQSQLRDDDDYDDDGEKKKQ